MANNSINPGDYSAAQICVAFGIKRDTDLKVQREKLMEILKRKDQINGDEKTMAPIEKDKALLREQIRAIDNEIKLNTEELLRHLKTIYSI